MGTFSIWHWLIVLLVLAIPGAIIYVAASRARADRGVLSAGFKGWLLLLAVGLWLRPLGAVKGWADINTQNQAGYTQFPELRTIDITFLIADFTIATLVILFMMKRSSFFPIIFKYLVAFSIFAFPLSVVAAGSVLRHIYSIDVGFTQIIESILEDVFKWMGSSIAIVIWMIYVMRSRRVAITFVK